ncbi:hypothetical protein C8Q76DRAFT_799022 [Earliella scabrosa]|nr:hypothetical protein C8Q76DRAFT_799022 [Earliella scabrosa]
MSEKTSSTQFGYEDHFQPARTRKKRKNRPPSEPPSPAVLLARASEELAGTDWLRDTLRTLRDALEDAFPAADVVPDVLCLGLGSPSSSRDARAQLALLLAACDDLRIERTKVSVFDPVFVEQDRELIAHCRLTALPENRMARHALESPTIVFMPHCDLHLYENLFRENWASERLGNVLLIANRLSEYAESIPSRKIAAESPCLARLGKLSLPSTRTRSHAHTHTRPPRLPDACPRPFRASRLYSLSRTPIRELDYAPSRSPRYAATTSERSLAPACPLAAGQLATSTLLDPLAFAHARPHAAPYLTSRPLQPCATHPTAFNNTAIQFVRASALAEREPDWWALPRAPGSIPARNELRRGDASSALPSPFPSPSPSASASALLPPSRASPPPSSSPSPGRGGADHAHVVGRALGPTPPANSPSAVPSGGSSSTIADDAARRVDSSSYPMQVSAPVRVTADADADAEHEPERIPSSSS